MTSYRITVRYGRRVHRYHTLEIDAGDAAQALRRVADELPEDMAARTDLVELRLAVDPEDRPITD